MSCAPSISQKAAQAALEGPQTCVEEMRLAYKKNCEMTISMCGKLLIPYVKPSGAFYMMIALPANEKRDSLQFSLDLIQKIKLAVAPGITFGSKGAGYIRLALCANENSISQGIKRLATLY